MCVRMSSLSRQEKNQTHRIWFLYYFLYVLTDIREYLVIWVFFQLSIKFKHENYISKALLDYCSKSY